MDPKKYPPINFKISKEEIEELVKNELLTEDYLLKDVSGQNALTRLLYSIVWKNGGLAKIRHIVEGIVSDDHRDK